MAKNKGGKKKSHNGAARGGPEKKSEPPPASEPESAEPPEPEAPHADEVVAARVKVSDAEKIGEQEREDDLDARPSVGDPPASSKKAAHTHPHGASWASPLVAIERWWTYFELRLLVIVILGLVFSMVLWISLQGMSSPVESQSNAGVVFRAVIGSLLFGVGAWILTGQLKLDRLKRTVGGILGILVGVLLAPTWRAVGVDYFGHIQGWLQEGSSLTMFGQLRGVSTRLTILLAFIGGSLAAATGKHINIDVALRFVPEKLKTPVFVAQNVATIAFCFVASWGFFEYIAITNFNAKPEMTWSQKYDTVDDDVSQDLFLWRKQIWFDLQAFPHVMGGGKWDDPERLNGKQWNEFVESSGYRERFTAKEVEDLLAPADALTESRLALAIGPEGQPRNLLVRTMNLTFAAGFVFMALRFLLRMLLVLSGHQSMEPEADYDPEDDPERHAERERLAKEVAAQAGVKKGGG